MADEVNLSAIFNRLEGEWAFTREIDNPEATASGTARFTRSTEADTLQYREDGTLRHAGGEQGEFYKSYTYRLEPGGIAVYFNDGKDAGALFQRLKMNAAPAEGVYTSEAAHYCDPDNYSSLYAFGPDAFSVTHLVKGPRKDYRSVTRFQRVNK